MKINSFVKTHGLGNDYVVLDKDNISFDLTEKAIKRICNVHFGIGSDGILLKVDSDKADFGLKVFNPDGSEAEISGNGLRIFCKFLYDYGFCLHKEFTVETMGRIVNARIMKTTFKKARSVSVEMGKAIFDSKAIPTGFLSGEVIGETLAVRDKVYEINCVSVGNPHCVIITDKLSEDEIRAYGKDIENHSVFPNRINVQFVKVLSSRLAEILIWERGAGFTLASGSSACAVASVLKKRGLSANDVHIKMQGGELKISVDNEWNIKMTGEVRQIAEGILSGELIEDLEI
ncbi:MAG: diaminopimelate epimerase [Clostridiales bacterium]|nr:diaminopimelate epimerase [Clostridiales bacterium]